MPSYTSVPKPTTTITSVGTAGLELFKEDGTSLLQEDGTFILLEQLNDITSLAKPSTSYTSIGKPS